MKTPWILTGLAVFMSSLGAQTVKMKTFSIGDTLIDVADFLETRIEEDTLVAYFPQSDFANARFSVITVKKDGNEVSAAGEKIIRERAEKLGANLNAEKNCIWYYTSARASEGSPESMMHYWYVGMGGQVVIASCFIDSAHQDSADAKRVLDTLPLSVKSIRRKQPNEAVDSTASRVILPAGGASPPKTQEARREKP